jgi:hypothetical protein
MVHSRYVWSVLGVVILGLVAIGLVVLGLVVLIMVHSRYAPSLEWTVLGMVFSSNGRVRNCRVRNGRARIGRSRLGTSTADSPS